MENILRYEPQIKTMFVFQDNIEILNKKKNKSSVFVFNDINNEQKFIPYGLIPNFENGKYLFNKEKIDLERSNNLKYPSYFLKGEKLEQTLFKTKYLNNIFDLIEKYFGDLNLTKENIKLTNEERKILTKNFKKINFEQKIKINLNMQ